jgi:hypothetical protein
VNRPRAASDLPSSSSSSTADVPAPSDLLKKLQQTIEWCEMSGKDALVDLRHLREIQSALTADVPAPGGETEKARLLRNRIVAIREAASKPTRDFDLQWQIGRFIDDFESAFGLESSALASLHGPSGRSPQEEKKS